MNTRTAITMLAITLLSAGAAHAQAPSSALPSYADAPVASNRAGDTQYREAASEALFDASSLLSQANFPNLSARAEVLAHSIVARNLPWGEAQKRALKLRDDCIRARAPQPAIDKVKDALKQIRGALLAGY